MQKITAEDPDVPSVACRDGTTEVLAISRDYTRFVDRGTGLVAALTGHGAYRLDLDRPVDGGRSWQLPVLLAHLLEAEGRLAGPEEPADLTLLATGEVDRDQRVRRVGRIPEKVAAADDLMARHGERGPPLVLVLPAADRTPATEAALPAADGPAGEMVRVLAWERVMGLAALEAPPADPPAPGRGSRCDAADAAEGEREEGRAGESAVLAASENAGRPARKDAAGGPVDEPHPGPSGGRSADLGDVESPAHPASAAQTAPPQGRAAAGGSGDPATVSLPPGGAAPARPRRRIARAAVAMLLVAAAVGAAAGAAWWNGPRDWEALRRAGDYLALEGALERAVVPFLAERYRSGLLATAPPPESLIFRVVEQRTVDGTPCRRGEFRGANRTDDTRLVGTPAPPEKPGFFRSERAASLCQAIYRVTNEGERLVYLYFAVRPLLPVRAHGSTTPAPLRRAAALPPGASLALDLELGSQTALPLGADLLILAAPSPAPQLRQAFESATASGDAWAAEDSGSSGLIALPPLGLTVKGASHAILR